MSNLKIVWCVVNDNGSSLGLADNTVWTYAAKEAMAKNKQDSPHDVWGVCPRIELPNGRHVTLDDFVKHHDAIEAAADEIAQRQHDASEAWLELQDAIRSAGDQ